MYFKNMIIYIYIYIMLQTLYGWSMDEGVYVDHIHHPCGM
jgi:hypothetical protein